MCARVGCCRSRLWHALRAQRPEDGLLSEEEKDNAERLSQSHIWIVDPVDGTREYGEARTDWAMHVGLAIDGVPTIGAVGLPGLGVVFRTNAPVPVPEAPTKLRDHARDRLTRRAMLKRAGPSGSPFLFLLAGAAASGRHQHVGHPAVDEDVNAVDVRRGR